MAFVEREISDADGRTVSLYELRWGATAWRYAGASSDITIRQPISAIDPGVATERAVYRATAIRDDGVTQGASANNALQVMLPADTPIIDLFRATPPNGEIWLTVRRRHLADAADDWLVHWIGTVASVRRENAAQAVLVGRSLLAGLERQGLRKTWSRQCSHVLYDDGCRAVPERFGVDGSVTAVSGDGSATIAHSAAVAQDYFKAGYIEWNAGENEPPAPAAFGGELPLTNPDATNGVDGWTIDSGLFAAVRFFGRPAFYGGARQTYSEMHQDAVLPAEFAGLILTATWDQASFEGRDEGALALAFLDAAGEETGTAESAFSSINDQQSYATRRIVMQIPAGTAKVRVTLKARHRTGNNNNVYFARIRLSAAPASAPPPRTLDRRTILRSFTDGRFILLGGAARLAVDTPVRIYPGCDLLAATCHNKFGNLANFGGFEQMAGESPFGSEKNIF